MTNGQADTWSILMGTLRTATPFLYLMCRPSSGYFQQTSSQRHAVRSHPAEARTPAQSSRAPGPVLALLVVVRGHEDLSGARNSQGYAFRPVSAPPSGCRA